MITINSLEAKAWIPQLFLLQAWCNHNELVERAAALRDFKLLVGSGALDFTKGMDSLDEYVEQISFRQWVTFSEHGQLKGWQPRFQTTEAKSLVCSSHIGELISAFSHFLKNNNSVTKTLCFSAWDWIFSEAATKGWAWCNHNAELVERMVALRNLLLVGSGCLEIRKGTAGMDVFRQCVTFREHRQLKGWQPHFQPTVAKSSISTSVRWFAAVSYHNWEHKHCIVTNLGDQNCPTKPSASLLDESFFCSCNEGMGMM